MWQICSRVGIKLGSPLSELAQLLARVPGMPDDVLLGDVAVGERHLVDEEIEVPSLMQ